MRPTVGRIVHYFPDSDANTPVPAIVTRVWSDDCVNLHVFTDGTADRVPNKIPTSVPRRAEGETRGRWDWPPMQPALREPAPPTPGNAPEPSTPPAPTTASETVAVAAGG